jgi:hypothetical protein
MSDPYAYRLNVFTNETKIWLERDGFKIQEGEATPRTFSYDYVSQIRLSYEPSRASADLYMCRIFVKGRAAPVATVSSTYYRGFLEFEARLPAYRAFVQTLHRDLSERPGVVYRAGVSGIAYWGNAVFLTVVLVFSALLLAPIIADSVITGMVWVKLAIIAFLAPLAASWFWSNRPREYNPSAIPDELLPARESQIDPT